MLITTEISSPLWGEDTVPLCRTAIPYHLDISKEGMSFNDTSHH
jgi:hypothetical protein